MSEPIDKISDENEALDLDCGEYDEPNLTEEECLDLALDNARICVENGGDPWARSYLIDVQRIREQRDTAIAELESCRRDRDNWHRRFASVEKELAEKTEAALALAESWDALARQGGCTGTNCGGCTYGRCGHAITTAFAGPSSVEDYAALGAPIEDQRVLGDNQTSNEEN